MDQLCGVYLDSLYQENRCDYSNGKLNTYLDSTPPDTLFVGSSRVINNINPVLLGKKSKNLAFVKKHIYHNAALIDILDDQKKLPKKTLILNFEIEDLYMQSEESMLDQLYSLKYYYYKNDLVKKLIDRKGFQERIKMLSRVYRHNGEGWKLISYPLYYNCPQTDDSGYLPLFPSERDSIRLSKALIDDFKPFNFRKINPTTLGLLRGISNTCKRNNIELILITAPYYKFHKELKKGSEYFTGYAKKNGYKYIDFNKNKSPELDSRRLWYDNMHLNDDGVKVFSKYLKKELF